MVPYQPSHSQLYTVTLAYRTAPPKNTLKLGLSLTELTKEKQTAPKPAGISIQRQHESKASVLTWSPALVNNAAPETEAQKKTCISA